MQPDPGNVPNNHLFVPNSVWHMHGISQTPWLSNIIFGGWQWKQIRRIHLLLYNLCQRKGIPKKRPLPFYDHPWSHITMDFVTSLQLSHGDTVILTIIEWFSKAVNFVAYPNYLRLLKRQNYIGHNLRPGVKIHISGMEGFLSPPMARSTGKSRPWRGITLCNHLHPTLQPGAQNWPGLSMCIIPWPVRPQVHLPLRRPWVINHPCFLLRRER